MFFWWCFCRIFPPRFIVLGSANKKLIFRWAARKEYKDTPHNRTCKNLTHAHTHEHTHTYVRKDKQKMNTRCKRLKSIRCQLLRKKMENKVNNTLGTHNLKRRNPQYQSKKTQGKNKPRKRERECLCVCECMCVGGEWNIKTKTKGCRNVELRLSAAHIDRRSTLWCKTRISLFSLSLSLSRQ